ncbi:heparinase II/III family protein [Rhizobium sp. L1K21]|uniref:heparinase II/III family protein n=1 Tax=Rhizobium sp. L1K21 TaxID=2954933 RepID=UPI002091E75E|nr:heparinase II/III family protein [Rhizobium sp. L1K21]MCO6188025.1 heparinase II/III family protein [Rhizobium sp. L1K21]
MNISEGRQQIGLYIREAHRRFLMGFALGRVVMPVSFGRLPDRLIVAPTDLRSGDSFVADEMLEGRFLLAGRMFETGGVSPFDLELPSVEFANRLHSFGWLRNCRAAGGDAHCARARSILSDWIAICGRETSTIAWEPDNASRRLIAWLSHSTIVLRGADLKFYRRLLKSIAFHIRFLRAIAPYVADSEARLRCRIALAMASLALPASDATIKRAGRDLDRELERQICADGGHVSRNPQVLLELLLDLLPLRQTYINLGHPVPQVLMPTIDRMFPALRFFRHQGGELALFNGASASLANELASVLRYDETGGAPFKALPYMGYQRLAVGQTVVIVDTGQPLSEQDSRKAHAGCLSFEMSSGNHRFVVNSGSPRFAGQNYRQLARATAAHSTVTLDDTSSMHFSKSEYLGAIVDGGLTKVDVQRLGEGSGAEGIAARHNGYWESTGLIVERDIQVNSGGNIIRGRDRLVGGDGNDPLSTNAAQAVARFHIHPAIAIEQSGRNEVRLRAPDGETWMLSCIDAPIHVEESVFFADPSGIRLSHQLEIAFSAAGLPEIQWVFSKNH